MNGFQKQLATHETPVTKVEVVRGYYPSRVSWGRCELCQVRSGHDTNRVSITDAIDTLDFSACDACADCADSWRALAAEEHLPDHRDTHPAPPPTELDLEPVQFAAPAVSSSEHLVRELAVALGQGADIAKLDEGLDAFYESVQSKLTPEQDSDLRLLRGMASALRRQSEKGKAA